jgi:hypothetical protein
VQGPPTCPRMLFFTNRSRLGSVPRPATSLVSRTPYPAGQARPGRAECSWHACKVTSLLWQKDHVAKLSKHAMSALPHSLPKGCCNPHVLSEDD